MTANPEPLAEFFDAFVLGDGEEALQEIVDLVKELKRTGVSRQVALERLAGIPGVYVPSLYTVQYHADGTLAQVTPAPAAPATVTKRTVKLESSFFPDKKVVPYLQTVHNRVTIEVARGCAGRCRFCQAVKYYWPWRVRSYETVLDRAAAGLASSGFEEIAFASLSCTDYRDLEKLLAEVNRRYAAQRVSISLPSLRCDQFSLQVAANLGHAKRPTLTFAPEAGTERLRQVIAKDLPERQIEETLLLAWQMGWRVIKLYFMIGLPTETQEDIEGIVRLVRQIKKRAPGLNFTITVSPYVPKAQTAFQWAGMAPESVLRERLQYLMKSLPASVKSHAMDTSLLEGMLARGDRRMAAVIHAAWKAGARFDQWKEHLRYALWEAAFAACGIDRSWYLERERGADEILPWDHLIFGAGKQRLRQEFEESLLPAALPAPAEQPAAPQPVIPPVKKLPATPPPTVQRLRLCFFRRGVVRFLSHLEQIEVFRRAMRRATLPLTYTGGFSPQPKMSFGPAISVGYESESEYVEIDLARRCEPAEVQEKLAAVLPAGYGLLSARKVPLFFPSIDSLLNLAVYRIAAPVTEEQIARFLEQREIIVEKKRERQVTQIDVRPLVRQLTLEQGGVYLELRFGPKRTIKPERIVQLLCGMDETQAKLLRITRVALRIEKTDGTVSDA
jgi:radical SAM family uncharacterized protein/radical SAM-linked protein